MQIKFRGVRVDNGEFVFGDLLQQPVCRIVNSDGEFEIKPESVAQFVSNDIDGKEIYTGDHVMHMTYYRAGIAVSYYKNKAREFGLKMPPEFSDLCLQYNPNDFAALVPRAHYRPLDTFDRNIEEYMLVTSQDHERLMKEQAEWRYWIDEAIRGIEHKIQTVLF